MSEVSSIHTLDARNNISLELARQYFKLSPDRVFSEIQLARNQVGEILDKKKVSYSDLKTALVPSINRREIALVFDTLSISDDWYGRDVFARLIPLFHRNSNHSILIGDYSGRNKHQPQLLGALEEALVVRRKVEWKHSSQFYIIYINNVSDAAVTNFDAGLRDYCGYIGYADTTFGSRFKLFLSTILVNHFIKHRNIIIQGNEDDFDSDEDFNMFAYPFEENGYICRNVPSTLFDLFLSYKIERPVVAGFETDTEFSLNAVSPQPLSLSEFSVVIEEAKLRYLHEAKAGSLARAELKSMERHEIESIIRTRMADNYIYNLSIKEEAIKFNIIMELPSINDVPVRILAALEYKPQEKVLRLITLY